MAEDKGILGNITGNLMDDLKDKVDPSKLLSEKNLQKKRNSFWTCLIAAFLLIALALGAAVYYNATKVSLLTEGIQEHVNLGAVGLDESRAERFAEDTLNYLQGNANEWAPVLRIGDHILPIPEAFKSHMATVKGWFTSATAVLLAGLAIALVLLGRALIGVKGAKKGSFSLGGYYIGALVPLVLIAGVGLWGAFNFESLWNLLHQTLIPDGIFSAAEPIMQLFPVGLFRGYAKPVAIAFGILAGVVLALPVLLFPLSKLLTALFGKSRASGGGSSRSGSSRRSASSRRADAARKGGTARKSSGRSAKKTTSASK